MTKHRVQQGEKLSTIAARYGVSHQAFLGSNPDRETTTLPSGETVFRSLSIGDELLVPAGAAPLPVDEPRALGAVTQRPQAPQRLRFATREDIPRRALPKIGKQTTSQQQQQQQQPAKSTPSPIMYEERKHLFDLAQRALGIIDTPIAPLLGEHGKRAARTAQYQSVQRVVKELGVYATFNATHVSNIVAVRTAIQALGQQVDVYGALVTGGGTELQIEDAYHNMRAAALALQTTMLH